jgi:hypothetical protein
MPVELDHVFVCTSPGAPEAERLLQLGLLEGPPNQHPGQGTACRRFSFRNAMLELFWVCDHKEAQSEQTRRTLIWERWSGRDRDTCPFGICLRPADTRQGEPPFPSWKYRPAYLPEPLAMFVGEGGLAEPMWVYFDFMQRAQREKYFVEHPIGISDISGLTLTCTKPPDSDTSRLVMDDGVVSVRIGSKPLLEIEFDHARSSRTTDFRPQLPLLFRF